MSTQSRFIAMSYPIESFFRYIYVSGLVEIAKTADSEKIAKSKILEETTEKMKESKNNFNLRKKHFQVRAIIYYIHI